MDKLQWRVQGINHVLLSQGSKETAYVVTLSAVTGGAVQGGQLVLRLSAPPAYQPFDVISYPPEPEPEGEESPARKHGAEAPGEPVRRGKAGESR